VRSFATESPCIFSPKRGSCALILKSIFFSPIQIPGELGIAASTIGSTTVNETLFARSPLQQTYRFPDKLVALEHDNKLHLVTQNRNKRQSHGTQLPWCAAGSQLPRVPRDLVTQKPHSSAGQPDLSAQWVLKWVQNWRLQVDNGRHECNASILSIISVGLG